MSKINLTDATTLTNETSFVSTLNTNFAAIETAIDNTLSRDGTAPNSMSASLDMNSNRIINLPNAAGAQEPLTLGQANTLIGGGTIVVGSFDAIAPTTTKGDLIVKDTTTNARLAAGTSGYALIAAGAGSLPAWTGFLQTGTGASARTWQNKVKEIFSVKDFGAVGDGSTNDTVAIQSAINAAITAGGGAVYFPASSGTYKTTSELLIDLSSYSTRYQNRVLLYGDGPGASAIQNLTLGGNILKFLGKTSNVEAYFSISDLRITGNLVASSVGLNLTNVAFCQLHNVAIEGVAIGIDATDTEQIGIYDSEIRYNTIGIRGNAAVSVTSPNSWTFVNTTIGNNSIYGMQITNPNALTWIGGSVQYNGTIGGGATQFGIKVIDAGNSGGYGTITFNGMIFEGNGGVGDFISAQQAGSFKINTTFNTVSFLRTDLTTVGYGTNQIAISGAGTNANYKVINSSFGGAGAYAASAGRPAIANTNANALVDVDGLTFFWSATESPTSTTHYMASGGVINWNAGDVTLTHSTNALTFAGATSGYSFDTNVNTSTYVKTTAPSTQTNDFTVADTQNYIICNKGSTLTITLPAAASYTGRMLYVKTLQAFTVVSATSNVCPNTTNTPGTAILPGTAGAWCQMVSDGTNWIRMASSTIA